MVEGHVVKDDPVVDIWVEGSEHVLVADKERFFELVDRPGGFAGVCVTPDKEGSPPGVGREGPVGIRMGVLSGFGSLSFGADKVDV